MPQNRSVRQRQLTPETLERILHTYRHTRQRLLLFDYDGTLAPICSRPEEAVPGRELYKVLCTLVADRSNRVVISSGRDHATMERWFGKLPVSLAAEHGAFYREGRGGWHANLHHAPWDPELLELMNRFVERTPHSRLEQKQTALAWHYRETDEWLGTLRAQQLMTALIPLCMRLNLQIMPGSKVVEVKSPEFSKGSEVRRLLRRERYDFILAMGDDTTDDDMFRALPRAAVTVKVGAASEYARYNLWRQSDVLPFLERLAASGSTGHSVRETVTRGLRTVWGHFRNLLTNKKDDDENNLNYGIIGNCRTAALISERGNIEWLCFPDFDSPSVFAALLDRTKGGSFGFDVSDRYTVRQTYVPHTNILQTRFASDEGTFEVLDYMPCYHSFEKEHYLPAELYRYIRLIAGTPRFRVHYDPAPNYARGAVQFHFTAEFIESYSSADNKDRQYLYSSLPLQAIADREEIRLEKDEFLLLSYNEKVIPIDIEREKSSTAARWSTGSTGPTAPNSIPVTMRLSNGVCWC